MLTNKFLITIAVLAIISMLTSDASAQSMSKIYGYVRVDGLLTNNITVKLSGGGISGQPFNITSNDSDDTAGYYDFIIENGSGNGYTVSASINNRSGSYSFIMPPAGDWLANLSLSASPTPTPTPTPTATPTPRPSGELGGMVIRNDSSSFIPMSALNPTMTPKPKPSGVGATPTIAPTPTPTPAGIFSNIYVWLIAALIIAIAIATATILFLKK